MQPRAASRTFTLREFARLVAAVEPDTLPQGDLVARTLQGPLDLLADSKPG